MRKNAILGGFRGDNGNDFNSVAGVEKQEFMNTPELHHHKSCSFVAVSG